MAKQQVDTLKQAIRRRAYTLLEAHHPEILEGVEQRIGQGESPDKIYNELLYLLGDHDSRLARHCKLAAELIAESVS